MHGTAVAVLPSVTSTPTLRKSSLVSERKYKCQFCNHAFSRSEHRSRHERSHTKERPFKCMKCRSTFVRRDLLLRHDRTVHAKDGGIPLHSDGKRRAGPKARAIVGTPKQPTLTIDASALDEMDANSDDIFDVEAAAMLVADLHHKSTAGMHGSISPYEANSVGTFSPHGSHNGSFHGNAGMDPAGSYPSPATTTPQVHWDSFMPRAVSESKAHSVASFASSFDSQPSPDNVSTDAAQSLSKTARNFLSAISQSASLYPLPVSAPPSGVGTPRQASLPPSVNVQSPAALAWSNQPPSGSASANTPALTPNSSASATASNSTFTSVSTPVSAGSPPLASCPSAAKPQVAGDQERNIILDNIRSNGSAHAIPEGFRLPPLSSLNRYLSTYFGLFHHHLPFLHPASFSPTTVSPALLLAVLSIGALYALDQDQAYVLHIGSKVLVNQFLQHKENFSSRRCPLWTMQASLLNMIFASWSGDPKGLEWACSIKSLLANMVAGNRYELKLRQDAHAESLPTWAEWVDDEGCRRTYYAVYIFFGLLTLTYNHTPVIGFNEFEDLQLPSHEALWDLGELDEAAWQEQRRADLPTLTVMEAHSNLFSGEPVRYSAFATRVMINTLFLEVWYHKRSPEALQDVVTEYRLRFALETWNRSLELCEPEVGMDPVSAPPKSQHPLISNALALYRNARARLEVDLKAVQEVLRYHDPYEVAAAMSNARDRVRRSSEMIKVIEECYNCIEIAVAQGVRWVARTSPTKWSIEHPLCGIDLMIVLSLWLYRLEHDDEPATEEETMMYNRLRILLTQDQDQDQASDSLLSSVVARLWGSMLDEVVVWGITRLLGESFRLHSQALVGYLDDIEAMSPTSTSSEGSQAAGDEDL